MPLNQGHANRYLVDNDGLKPAGRLLIFVNPVSGCSRSQEIFRRRLEPMLHERGFCYEVVHTSEFGWISFTQPVLKERRGHAEYHIRSRNDLHLFTGIVICSGDGMIFEVSKARRLMSDDYDYEDIGHEFRW